MKLDVAQSLWLRGRRYGAWTTAIGAVVFRCSAPEDQSSDDERVLVISEPRSDRALPHWSQDSNVFDVPVR
jgi:hypothetical protein